MGKIKDRLEIQVGGYNINLHFADNAVLMAENAEDLQ